MRVSMYHLLMVGFIGTSLWACTPTDQTASAPDEIVATGDDSSVRPDNDKDD